jgi:hypothetical protein
MVKLMQRNANVLGRILHIPRQRRPLTRFSFRVSPASGEAFVVDLWADDVAAAIPRATELASQACGSSATVELVPS